MADSNFASALKDDGFVDFYELLGTTPDASGDDVRARINDLYSEAQANRDHRNIARRRDYELLLELLPQARTALLDPAKRARYDAYAKQARNGGGSPDFETFMSQLSGRADQDEEQRAGLLGVQEGRQVATAPTSTAKVSPPPASAGAKRKKTAQRQQKSLTSWVITVAMFFVAFVIVHYAMHRNIDVVTVAICAIIALITRAVSYALLTGARPGKV